MRAKEIFKPFKIYTAKIFIRQPRYNGYLTATVNATDLISARNLIRIQYNVENSQIGEIRELKP